MKFLFSILLLAAIIPAQAQSRPPRQGGDLEQRLEDCRRTCAPQCARLVSRISNQLEDINYSCNFQPPRRGGSVVKFYHSDTCSGEYMGSVSSERDCESFGKVNTINVWAISIDNKCMDIVDTNPLAACNAFTNASKDDVILYKSDTCSESAVGFINQDTNCSSYARSVDTGARVWAIRVNNRCVDVPDVDLESACIKYKNEY